MTVEELIKTYKAAGDAAYDDYRAMVSRPVRKEEEPDASGKFSAEALRLRRTSSESIGEARGKHRACVVFVQALTSLQPQN